MKKTFFGKIFAFVAMALLVLVAVACGKEPAVEVKLAFDKAELTVEVGDEFDIKTTITGVDASTPVEFAFDKEGIVELKDGKFTALKAGDVVITGTVKDYADAKASLKVKVNEKAVNANITLTAEKTEGYVGEDIAVSANVTGDVEDMSLTFEVDCANATYASGVLHLVAPGEVTLTAKLTAYPSVKASVKINILEKDPTIEITPSATTIPVGGKATVAAVVDPSTLEVEWSSDNTAVATVDKGVVTGVAIGKANITAKIKGTEISKSFEINVAELVTSIDVQYQPEMEVMGSQTLVVTVLPETAGDKTYTITCDNDAILMIYQDNLTAVDAGKVKVTVTANDGSGVKKEFEITITDPSLNVQTTLCDPAVASLSYGTEYEYKGQTFLVGKTAFANIDAAIEATQNKVLVAAGTYEGQITIDKDNVELLGPNDGVNPSTITRLPEAVITGKIFISEGLKSIKVSGFEFTGAGMIDCQNSVDGVTVTYNYAHDTDEADAWVESRVELKAVFDFWFVAGYEGKNINVNYNKLENIKKVGIFVARAKNVAINNNTVHNFTHDAIRADGGYNYGYWQFDNNTIYNDELGGYNGIYLQSISGKDDDGAQVIEVTNNTIKNVGNTTTTSVYTGAFGARTYQEEGLEANFLYNTFENCVNYVVLRNNGATADTFQANINYNKIIGIPTGVYHRNITPGSNDTTASNPILTNMDLNLFYDNDGQIITDLTPYAEKFVDLKSYVNNFTTLEDYETKLKELLGVSFNAVVDDSWAGLEDGTKVEAEGFTWTIGGNAFSTISACLATLESGATIKVLAGDYPETLGIGINNLTILGPNNGVNAQYINREAEAVLSNVISIADGVTNFTVDGFEVTGAFALRPGKDVDGLGLKYCVINGTSSDGIIHSLDDKNNPGYVNNVKFIGNYSTNYKGNRVLHLTFVNGLDASNNYIQTTGAPYDFLNVQGVISGECIFKDNTFIGGSNQSFLYAVNVGEINCLIQGNYVDDVFCTCVDFRGTTIANAHNVFNILNNTFKNSGSDWRPIRIRTAGYTEGCSIEVNVNYNKFIDSYVTVDNQITFVNNPSSGSVAAEFDAIYNMDNNYYEVNGAPVIPDSNAYFGNAAKSWANTYENENDMPAYSAQSEVKPTSVEITNKITALDAYDTYQLTFKIGPDDATNKKVAFKSDNSKAAVVSSAGLISAKSGGTAVITAYCVADNTVIDTMTIEVAPKSRIEIRCEGNGVLYVGGATATLEVTYFGADGSTPTYETNDATIATVNEAGVVTPVGAGQAVITVKQGGKEASIGFTVVSGELTGLIKVLADGNHATIWNQNIMYIGSDDGSADYEHNINGSANDYYAGNIPAVTKKMLSTSAPNYSGMTMKSVEFVVIHDTAGSPSTSTAAANAGWCTNPSNTGSSWNYTIGNDGIYQQLEDNVVGWHAGDGTSWASTVTMHDTGIAYEGDRPKVTIGADFYFYINGKKSNIKSPSTTVTTLNTLGMICFKGANGNYFMPDTWVCSQFGDRVCARGGNLNGIGIETAVNMGSDVYLTWQYTAKYVAQLLVKYNLAADRVWFHNNFTNKKCPNTMITADRVETFLKLVYAEYEVAKNYAGYTITFESSNPAILDNTGRVVKAPEYTTNVSYKVTVSNGTDTQEITLNTLVIGQYNL